jgi:hypothetical protein
MPSDGILDAGVVQAPLPALVGSEHDPLATNASRYAVGQLDLSQTDAGHVACGHQPGQQVELAVRGVPGGRIQDALGLEDVAGFGGHQNADAGQGVGDSHSEGPFDARRLIP